MRFLSVALVVLSSAAAHAEGESARDHYQKGLSSYALGRFKVAAEEYEAAFDLKPDPALLYNAAQAHRLAGNKQRALFLYENYLRLFPNRPNEKEVHRHILALKAAIESDARAQSSPPIEPLAAPPPSPAPAAVEPRPQTAALTEVAAPPPPRRSQPRWVWGVVGGVVGAVALGLGLGLGLGLSGTDYPNASRTVTLK